MSAPTTPAVDDPAAAAADLWDRVLALAGGLADDDWARPTPCEGWDVHDLLAHLAGIQTLFDATAPQPDPPEGWEPPAGSGGLDVWTERGVAARRGWTREQVLAELATARDGHVARLAAVTDWTAEQPGPTGQTTEAGLFAVRGFDVWVHLQDLRLALGRDVEVGDPSPGARTAYGFVHGLVPYLYAKRAEAPVGSAMRLRLREPYPFDSVLARGEDGRARWDADADPGRCVVDADPAVFTLLVTGRVEPEPSRDAGHLDWNGAAAAAFVARARMF